MPIFKPELIDKIVTGDKTQTRRPVKDGDVLVRVESPHGGYKTIGMFHNERARMLIGRDYAVVPGRSKPGVCWQPALQTWRETGANNRCDAESKMLRIRVLDIRREDVRNISLEDAMAEGFDTRSEFWEVWCSFYDVQGLKIIAAHKPHNMIVQAGLLQERPDELYQAWAYTFEVVR